MKRLLIFEPNTSSGKKLVSSAQNMNVDVIAVTSEKVYINEYDEKLKKSISDVIYTDFLDKSVEIPIIIDKSRKLKVQGVVSGFEFFSDWAVLVANGLDLPTHNIENVSAFRDKVQMYNIFKKNNVPTPHTTIIEHNFSDENINYPCIIKPSKNAGSFGVQTVSNKNELIKCIKRITDNDIEFPHGFKLNSQIMCQEVLYGPEISVEVIAQNSVFNILALTQKITTAGDYFAEVGHVVPAPIDNVERETISQVIFHALRSLGYRNGIAHAELILTDDGPKVLEIGARLPGDFIPELVERSTHNDEAAMYISVAFGDTISIHHEVGNYSGIHFISAQEDMIYHSTKIEGSLNEKSNVVIYANKGEHFSKTKDNMSRIGHITSNSDSYLKLTNRLNEEIQRIKIISEDLIDEKNRSY